MERGDRDMTTAIERMLAGGLEHTANTPLPPESLRQRVHGAADAESFLAVGQQCAKDIVAALDRVGRGSDSFAAVLDFGCGCGRVLRWLMPKFAMARVFGTDIDRQAVGWCHKHIAGGAFILNAGLPPSGFASNSFDLIYAISVFSHLNEEYQFHWLNELRRMTRPGGVVLVSLHGSHYMDKLSPDILTHIENQGMIFIVSDGWKGVLPHWYQSAFHSEAYVLKQYARYFDVLAYIPGGINGVQDAVVLQRRTNDEPLLEQEIRSYSGVRQLHARIRSLEHLIDIKNEHIAGLETTIERLQSRRGMRLVRRIM
jgi:SAM-dependent methyltransferase